MSLHAHAAPGATLCCRRTKITAYGTGRSGGYRPWSVPSSLREARRPFVATPRYLRQ